MFQFEMTVRYLSRLTKEAVDCVSLDSAGEVQDESMNVLII